MILQSKEANAIGQDEGTPINTVGTSHSVRSPMVHREARRYGHQQDSSPTAANGTLFTI